MRFHEAVEFRFPKEGHPGGPVFGKSSPTFEGPDRDTTVSSGFPFRHEVVIPEKGENFTERDEPVFIEYLHSRFLFFLWTVDRTLSIERVCVCPGHLNRCPGQVSTTSNS